MSTLANPMTFALAGNATFTLVSQITETRFTYRVQAAENGPMHFVKVLTGPDNQNDYRYLGYLRRGVYFHGGAKAKIAKDAPSAKAFDWFWRKLAQGAAMIVVALDPNFRPEDLGFLPSFLDDEDPRPARDQLDAHYAHGGGWRHQPGFTRVDGSYALKYPGDPPLQPLAAILFRDETIFFYPHAYVALFARDGSFEISRMD